jgi:hypothetical protein
MASSSDPDFSEISDSPQVGQHPPFSLLLEQFNRTLEAVTEVLDAVSPHVAGLDEPANLTITLPPPSDENFEILREAFDRQSGDQAAGEAQEEPVSASNALGKDFVSALAQAYKDQPRILREIGRTFWSVGARPRREHLMHGALLTMAVGTLETAIAGVATQHYFLHPGALPSSEKEFSLSDLADFEDLSDARDLAISRKVETLMRGGFDSWGLWFEDLLGEGFGGLASDHGVLQEAIQRRHLVVHNAGRVSRQYKAKVSSCEESVGSELPIKRSYLETAIDEISIFGVRLILTAWSKWCPSERDDAAEDGNKLVFSQLRSGHLNVARCVAQTAKEIAEEERLRLFLQVNQWQAEKRLNGLDSIRPEIENWDSSALSPLFAAAKAALLDDYDDLFSRLPDLLKQDEIRPADLRNWPLFREAREQEQWIDLEESLPSAQEGDATDSNFTDSDGGSPHVDNNQES